MASLIWGQMNFYTYALRGMLVAQKSSGVRRPNGGRGGSSQAHPEIVPRALRTTWDDTVGHGLLLSTAIELN